MSVAQNDGIRAADAISYDDLYRRWEEPPNGAPPRSTSPKTPRAGTALSDIQKKSGLAFTRCSSTARTPSPTISPPTLTPRRARSRSTSSATQQVDEVRHAVFFHRFFREVIGAGETIQATLASTEPELNWGYRNVFSRLDRMAEELRRDRSLPKFAQAIALYHMVVEASMAQPGQHFIEDFFANEGTLPGFTEGMANVSRDEQRHIGFGVKVLSELFEESDECRAAVHELLLDVMPYVAAVFNPPNFDREYTRCYGFEMEDIFEFGMKSVLTQAARDRLAARGDARGPAHGLHA